MARTRRTLLLATLVLLAMLAAIPPERASAANARVAIANYMWTPQDIRLDLGEHVTWYWTGPDTMHSVTGITENAKGIDTDPQSRLPEHDLGDTFQYTFEKPGVYRFQCKLHTLVGGTVTVSDKPGDPVSEPDPVPKINVDRSKPVIRDVRLRKTRFGRKGTSMQFSLNDAGKLDAEYYRYEGSGGRKKGAPGKGARNGGKGGGKQSRAARGKQKLKFAGWTRWKAHIGWNNARLGARSKRFKPRPGRYVAVLRATDRTANESRPVRIGFTIWRR